MLNIYKKALILITFFISFFTPAATVSAQDNLDLKLIYTYSFEKGYYNTFMEVSDNEVGLICPNLRRIYLIDVKAHEIKSIQFKNGRGPGEILRGPFGLDIGKEFIYLADPDLQRFSVYNRKNSSFKTELHHSVPPMSGIYNFEGPYILTPPKTIKSLAYFIYNPENKTVVKKYKLPKVPKSVYRFSGEPAVNEEYIIHANRYYADLLIWNKKTAKFIKKSTVKETEKPGITKAKFKGMVGTIPPQDPELEIFDLARNPESSKHVFLLMESRDNKISTKWVYNFDFIKEEIVGKEKLKADATLLTSNDKYLFIYSENADELYQYEVKQK